jgi:hypothetical protein
MYSSKIANYEIEKNFYVVYPISSIILIIILLIFVVQEDLARIDKPIVALILMIYQLIHNLIRRDKLKKKEDRVKEKGKCYNGEIIKPIIYKKWFGLVKCYSLLVTFSTPDR